MIERKEASAERDEMWRETAWDELSRGTRGGAATPTVQRSRTTGPFKEHSTLPGRSSIVGPLAFVRPLRVIRHGAEVPEPHAADWRRIHEALKAAGEEFANTLVVAGQPLG